MSVYLYWFWADQLAGASCSEAHRAPRPRLTGKSRVLVQVWSFPGDAEGSRAVFGAVQPKPSAVDAKDT